MIDLNCIVGRNKYGQYAVPRASTTRPACSMILQGNVYEQDTIQYMLDKCGDGAIIHAGTFFGDFLPALGTLENTVYAFEPVTDSYNHAQATLDLNFEDGKSNIQLYNYGLGEKEELLTIMHSDPSGTNLGGAARYDYNKAIAPPESVQETQVVRLDDIVEDHSNVAIIQLDVEGFEESALKGALSIIEHSKPHIILEVWDNGRIHTEFYEEYIFGAGYSESRWLHDNIVLVHT